MDNLDQTSAREIERVLLSSGIKADVSLGKGGSFSVVVDQAARLAALNIIAGAGLPQKEFVSIDKLFPASGLIVTPIEQKARLAFGIEQQLAQTLSSIDGVLSARVHVALPANDGSSAIEEKARAAALVIYRESANTPLIEEEARRLMLNSIRDLAFEDVSVVLSRAVNSLPADGSHSAAAGRVATTAGGSMLSIGALAGGFALAIFAILQLLPLDRRPRKLTKLPTEASFSAPLP